MNALVGDRVLTAQQLFKAQYGRTLRWSTIGALLALIVIVLVMPEYRPNAYRLSEDAIVLREIEMIAPEIDEPPTVAPPRQPEVEPVADDDPGAVDDVPFIDGLVDVPSAPTDWGGSSGDAPFVATAENPRLLQGAVADYPEIARLAGLQGTVVVDVLVGKYGTVERVALLKGVHPLIDRPALAAAKRLVFAPGTQRGIAVPCHVAVPFRFFLH